MRWGNYVLDASMGWPPCFCPIEGDLDGDYEIVTGMNFIGSPPEGGKVVAIIHDGGQAAVDQFYDRYKDDLREWIDRRVPRAPTPSPLPCDGADGTEDKP